VILAVIVIHADVRCTASSEDEILQYYPELNGISFPNIRKWKIEGKNEFFAAFDVSSADTIEFRSYNRPMDRLFAPLPTQLTTLTLDLVIFTPESLQGGQRYSLPLLTDLKLSDIVFLGPMRRYFHCPKLTHLSYTISSSVYANITTVESIRNHYRALVQETFDATFFQESSALCSISFKGTMMDDKLVPILASCSALNNLEIWNCRIGRFIRPFLEKLQDRKYFPTLRLLTIDYSWPFLPGFLFKEFVEACGSKRPELYVSGNGQPEIGATSHNDQHRSDSRSDSDEDSSEESDDNNSDDSDGDSDDDDSDDDDGA
jgi:hypothetical protein